MPWSFRPSIQLDLAAQPAERYRDVPREAIESAQSLLKAVENELPPGARMLADAARLRTGGRFQNEIQSLAKQFNADWRNLMLANLSYDMLLANLGCSTMALATTEGPVLARNMDWWPADLLAQATYEIRYYRGDQRQFTLAGWPGCVGAVTGMSTRGFAVALNAVQSPEPPNKLGYPVLLLLRRVLEDARNFDEAVSELSTQRITVGALFTLVGVSNDQRAVIERTPTRAVRRTSEDGGPLVATNDYHAMNNSGELDELFEQMLGQSACSRYDALHNALASEQGQSSCSDNQLLYHLTDPAVMQSITAQHVIARPIDDHMTVAVPSGLLNNKHAEQASV